MHQITRKAALALLGCKKFSSGNTRVRLEEYDGEAYSELKLHGNRIARYFPSVHRLILSDAGWQTVTIKDRLNGVLAVAGLNARIYQRDFKWHIKSNGKDYEWQGWTRFRVPSKEPAQPTPLPELIAA